MALRLRRLDYFDAPGLQAAWARLSAASPRASLFSTYEWCRCWAETVGRRAQVTILLIEDERNQPVGLLPACIERSGPTRWLKLLGRERVSGDHLDLLCAAEDHWSCLSTFVEYLDERGDYDGLVLGELERDSPTLARLADWATARAHAFHEREQRVVPYVDLPARFEDYLASLSSNMRYHIRRRRRDLHKLPDSSVSLLRDWEEVDRALDDLFRLHETRWRRDGQAGVFQSPLKQQFLRQFCRVACARGWARCYVLEIGREREAVLLAFHWTGTASYYQMGWNPDGAIQSPGVILLAESIEQSIREGLSKYDFLRGDEEYKQKWTSQSVAQTTLVVGRRVPARAAMTAERLKNRFKHAFQQTLGAGRWESMKRGLGGWAP